MATKSPRSSGAGAGFLDGLTVDEMNALSAHAAVQHYPKNAVIINVPAATRDLSAGRQLRAARPRYAGAL